MKPWKTISAFAARPFGLTAKLFVVMAVVNIMLVSAMAIGDRLSYERVFLGYLAEEDLKRLDETIPPLAAAYAEHGNWDFITQDHQNWHQLLRPYGHAYQNITHPVQPPPEADLVGANLRFSLLDPGGKYLTGNPEASERFPRKPIVVAGHTVGWLVIVPIQNVTEVGNLRLVIAERDVTWALAVIATLLAIVISLWLARALGLPLQKVARSTHVLAEGDFKVRVSESSGGELGQLERDFNHLAQTLERNEKTRAALFADISHELRTPLAVMQGEVEALQVGIRPMSHDAMRSLAAELTRLSHLVDDLHHLSRSDAGDLPYYYADVDIVEALADVLHPVRRSLAGAGIRLEEILPETACWVSGDERRLQQVFSNIFQNVLRYVNAGALLVVSIRQTARHVHIDIQDSGTGVPEDALEALFQRFYRVEASRSRATGGAGLGLAICRSIVEAHQGTISAARAPQGGLWLAIVLPRAPQTGEAQ